MIPTSVSSVRLRHGVVEILRVGIPVLQPAAWEKIHDEKPVRDQKKNKKGQIQESPERQKAWNKNQETSYGDQKLGFNEIISVALYRLNIKAPKSSLYHVCPRLRGNIISYKEATF